MLRTCASCAAQIPQTAPRCASCKTRYCGRDCQKRHWKGGHKQLCDQIKRRGGAEQCNAEKRHKDAVAVAVAKCADDTKGQTCYICTQALHWKTKEGLVRMCACRGTAGFAHVSCLAEQAKILVAEYEENSSASASNAAVVRGRVERSTSITQTLQGSTIRPARREVVLPLGREGARSSSDGSGAWTRSWSTAPTPSTPGPNTIS